MPPKKKGVAARAKAKAAAATPPRAAVPDTITTSRGKEYETTAALSRPRRESAILQSPIELKNNKTAATPSKKRGRPAKATTDEEPPKKRGRPAKEVVDEVDEDEEQEVQEPPIKRKPGRPAKKVTGKRGPGRPAKKVAEKRGPGRPAKKVADEVDEVADGEEEGDEEIDEPAAAPKPRGRPTKNAAAKTPVKAAPKAVKKRGRPPKADVSTANQEAEENAEESVEEAEAPLKKRGHGRPAKKGKGAKAKEPSPDEEQAIDDEELEQSSSDKQYWLMKAEQEDREEILANGDAFNTKFTIDDLKANGGPEPWDGVRNAVAAKNMRAMKKGDLAFFYASGGKSGRKPGITGIMEIVKEHEPDQTTSDKGSYGYVKDENARGRWCVVHVEYRNKLSKPVHLSELQRYMDGRGVLSKMQVLKLPRLSVTSVSEAEWNFITENLIEGFEEEDVLPGAEATNGTSNPEEESTLITTEQPNGEVVINESTQPEQDLPASPGPAEAVLSTIESEIPSTDTIFPAETSQTSRPASRGGSRAPSIKLKATTSRQSSRAGSVAAGGLTLPATNGRGRSRTPSGRAGSAAQSNATKGDDAAGMPVIGEIDE